jgi:hypothetical protein
MARNGKIARLPNGAQAELNRRLDGPELGQPLLNCPDHFSSCCTEMPRSSNSRRIVSLIGLFGQLAPAVPPTVIWPGRLSPAPLELEVRRMKITKRTHFKNEATLSTAKHCVELCKI